MRLRNVCSLVFNKKFVISSSELNVASYAKSFSTSGWIGSKSPAQRDPAPLFFDKNVQNLLHKLTGLDLNVVYGQDKLRDIQTSTFKFMTDEELEQAKNRAAKKAEKRLQIPPIVRAREPKEEVIVRDIRLQGHDKSKYIFTDISLDKTDRSRLIVCRDTDGTLRHATWEERDRMNQIYFPTPGRSLVVPRMFEMENLQTLLDAGDYEYILDRNCAQFEPDHPTYLQVARATYDHIDANSAYDGLKSTRHFGSLVFYLAFYEKQDSLMLHLLKRNRIAEAATLIELYRSVHPDSELAKSKLSEHLDLVELVKLYLKLASKNRYPLELALQSYIEHLENRDRKVDDESQQAEN